MTQKTANAPVSAKCASAASLERMSMAALPCMPLQAHWLTQLPAYLSSRAEIVRGAVQMLQSAWRNVPAGTLSVSLPALSLASGIPMDRIAADADELCAGWEVRDGRLVHPGMYETAVRLWTEQAQALDHLSSTAAMVVQDPEAFELVAPEAASASPLRGRRRLPASFGLTPPLREWLAASLHVADERDQQFLMDKFRDWALSKNEMMSNPTAAFRLFCSRENLRLLPSRNGAVAPVRAGAAGAFMDRMTRFGNGGEVATQRNQSAMERAMGNVAAPAPAEGVRG